MDSSSSIISIALILGAPDTVPAGKPAKRDLNLENLLSCLPITFETICITCEYFSIIKLSVTLIELVLDLLAKDCKIILVGDKNQLSPVKDCSIWNYLFEYSDNNIIQSCIVNLNKTYRNSGDIELLSNLIFNNKNSIFQKKIKIIYLLQ